MTGWGARNLNEAETRRGSEASERLREQARFPGRERGRDRLVTPESASVRVSANLKCNGSCQR